MTAVLLYTQSGAFQFEKKSESGGNGGPSAMYIQLPLRPIALQAIRVIASRVIARRDCISPTSGHIAYMRTDQ